MGDAHNHGFTTLEPSKQKSMFTNFVLVKAARSL